MSTKKHHPGGVGQALACPRSNHALFYLFLFLLLLASWAIAGCPGSSGDDDDSKEEGDDDSSNDDDDDDNDNDDDDDFEITVPAGWTIEQLAPATKFTSIALDSEDHIHIAYQLYDIFDQDEDIRLGYISNETGEWIENGVGWWHSFPDDLWPSINIDPNNQVSIALFDLGLSYFYLNQDGEWRYVESLEDEGTYLSSHIDSQGNLQITESRYEVFSGSVDYIVYSQGEWTITQLVPNNDGYPSASCLDADDKMHISFKDKKSDQILYGTNESGNWEYEAVPGSETGVLSSIAVDSQKAVHIMYILEDEEGFGPVYYTSKKGDEWATEYLGTISIHYYGRDYGPGLEIKSDIDDNMHFVMGDNNGLTYGKKTGEDWNLEQIHQYQSSALYTDLAIDSDGYAHITHIGQWDKYLYYITNKP